MDQVKIDYYSDLAHFKESRENLFGSLPDCLHMNFANNNRFLLVSRYSAVVQSGSIKINRESLVNEFHIFHCVSVKEENVKKWVMTNTIMYACVDYENIDRYVSLPVCVKLSQRAVTKLAKNLELVTEDQILAFNRYSGIAQLT